MIFYSNFTSSYAHIPALYVTFIDIACVCVCVCFIFFSLSFTPIKITTVSWCACFFFFLLNIIFLKCKKNDDTINIDMMICDWELKENLKHTHTRSVHYQLKINRWFLQMMILYIDDIDIDLKNKDQNSLCIYRMI